MPYIINMTPHPVNIVDEDGNVVETFSKSDQMIRLSQQIQSAGMVSGIPLTKTVFGEAENLPALKKGRFFIVSQLVKSALPDRPDLLVPAEVVRDDDGNIVGCRSLGI